MLITNKTICRVFITHAIDLVILHIRNTTSDVHA